MKEEQKAVLRSELHTRKKDLQNLLSGSDYKVIKCAEDKARGVAKANLPYDIDELHAQRQAWRDEINQIEADIAQLESMEEEEDGGVHDIEE